MTSIETRSKSSSSSSSPWKHDEFLSFRGEDTRTGFTDHLYHALDGKAIETFRDNEGLVRGESISPGLLKGIEESRFAIIVLSEKYATSSWCLDEVAEIVECKRVRGQSIIPVFYHVQPNHVRNQTGNFGEPFTGEHKDQDVNKVNKWREALTLVADIHPRWELKDDGRHDSDVIQEIANKIFKELYEIASKDLVGMDSRIKKIQALLEKCPSDDVCTIGIWGMGGIGKTTLARGFYQSMYDKFEASAFIGNVREEYGKNGMVHLQKLLYKILLNDTEGIHDDHMVTNVLSQRLRSKKVLIILDDVDKLEQIEGLVGSWKNHYNWLGRGSRVIVTTRDNHLVMNYGQDYIYKVDKLNDDEAVELLCQRAFDKNGVSDEYRELSIQVVEYANGHPLTLEVLSPYLKGKTVDEWSNILAELKEHPDDEPIHRTLQVSYNGLDKWEKKIFLDIACFFKGEDLYRVKKILDSCGFHPTVGVKVLIEKCFVTIASDKLWIHDMLQEFGHEIVRQESIDMLGKRSRLWNHKDARDVLENYKGTKAVQGIFLNLRENEELHLSEEKKIIEVKKLRLFKIHNVRNFSECGYLSNELRILEWHQYPLINIPSSFQPKNLVELNMSNSRIERLWEETTLSLEKLILLNLSNCEYLVETPDFSRVPNLQRLILEGCKRLSKIHQTIEKLKQLMLLNLKGCESLDSLPQGICFNFLETFILSGCTKLDRFPEIMGDMNRLSQLYLDGTAIKELPTSVERLSNLILLDLRECKNLLSLPDFICGFTSLENLNISGCSIVNQLPENIGSLEKLEKLDACRTATRKAPSSIVLLKNLKTLCFAQCSGTVVEGSSSESNVSFQLPNSFSGLSSLTCLSLAECNLEEGAIPEDIGCLSLLERLELSGNNFMSLPDSISQLSNLRHFGVVKCSRLQSLPKLPLNVKHVQAHDCPMLKDQMTIWPSDEGFSFIDTRKAEEAEGPLTHHPLPMPEEHIHKLLPKFIEDQIYHGGKLELRFPYARIPDWCSRWNKGSSLRIRLPEKDSSQTWIGFALFVVFLIKKQESFDDNRYRTFCHFYTDEGCLENPLEIESFNGFKVGSYGLCVFVPKTRFANQLDKPSHIEASISTNRLDVEVMQCGLHVIFNKDVPKFTQDLVDASNEHLNLTSIKHFMHILEKASELERSNYVHELQFDPSSRNQVFGTLHPASQLRRDLRALLSRIFFEGSLYTRNLPIPFSFPMTGFASGWFFHQSVGRSVVCYLPANILDDKSWIGFSLYATLKMSSSDLLKNYSDPETAPPLLHIDLHSHGSSISHIKTFDDLPIMPYSHQLLLFHAPRVYFEDDHLNRCWGISALFRTSIPNVEVERCGIHAVYEKDLGNVIEMITECQLNSPDLDDEQSCYQAYEMLVESITSTFQFVEPKSTSKQEMPIHSSCSSERDYESLQTNMYVLSAQRVDKEVSTAYEQLTIPHDPIVVHSKRNFMESSYKLFEETSSGDSKLGLIHLQIMAEAPLFENDLRWKRNLEDFLERHVSFYVFITLSLQGHIISVLKPFDPFLPYNFCFPRKEILEWFEGYQVNMRTVGIALPPNLKTDKDWRGIAVCVSFSVQEHPNAILDDDSSQVSLRLLCHLSTDQECCLNPAPVFHITKDKFKWSYVGEFIWLTYIPSYLLLAELHGQSYIVIDIYNECPGLITMNLGVRLLFEQDVEEFKQSITKCMTGLFDNLDPISQFLADHENERNPSHADESASRKNSKGCILQDFENEGPNKKQCHDDGDDPQHERLEGDKTILNPKDKGKRVLQ